MRAPSRNLITDQRGFTLFEILISLVILALAMTVILMGFQSVIGSWQKGERRIEVQQQDRLVLSTLGSLIRSTFPSHPIIEGRRVVQFLGAPDSLKFVTTGAINLHGERNPGIYEVTVYIDNDSGTKARGLVLRQDYAEGLKIEELDTSLLVELYPEVTELELEYYYESFNERGEREGHWTEQWNQEEEEMDFMEFVPEFPRATKITLGRYNVQTEQTVYLPSQIVPIYIGMDYYLRPYYSFAMFDQ